MTILFRWTLAAAVLLLPAAALHAQPLAEHVPADATFYLGWRGSADLGEAYGESNLRGIIEATQLEQLLTETLPRMLEEQAVDEPEAAEAAALMRALGPVLWQRPWAVYTVMAPGPDMDTPAGLFGLVIEAGDDAADVRQAFERLIAEIPEDAPLDERPQLIERDGVLILAMATDEARLGAASPADGGAVATLAAVMDAADATVKRPVLVAYVDGRGLMGLIEAGVEQDSSPEEVAKFRTATEAVGVDRIGRGLYVAGFAGEDWLSELFIEAEGLPSSLFGSVGGAPITDDELRLVPRSASWLSASRFDAGAAFDGLRAFLATVDEDGVPAMDRALAEAKAATGVDIEADVIRTLGDLWVLYNDPAVAGPLGLGVVLVSPVQEGQGQRLAEALAKLEGMANAQLEAAPDSMPFRFQTFENSGITIHSLAFPMVSPSWAVHEGRLYVALFPQAIVTAHLYAQNPDNSILENEKFQQTRSRLGDHPATKIGFTDLSQTAPMAYQQYMMITQTLSAMMPPGEAPPMLLPPLGQIMPYLSPSGSVTWIDEAGYHSRSISPFPGSVLLNPHGMMNVSSAALGAGIMLPALGAARTTARQMQSNTQARGIHQAAIMYAQGNNGRLADDLQTLHHGNYFSLDYILSPMGDTAVPHDFDEWSKEDQDAWIQENASYVLLPGLEETLNPDEIAIFLKPDHSNGRGISVGYQDNHVEWKPLVEAAAEIEAQTGKTIDELVEMAENGTLVPGSIENNVAEPSGVTEPASADPF